MPASNSVVKTYDSNGLWFATKSFWCLKIERRDHRFIQYYSNDNNDKIVVLHSKKERKKPLLFPTTGKITQREVLKETDSRRNKSEFAKFGIAHRCGGEEKIRGTRIAYHTRSAKN